MSTDKKPIWDAGAWLAWKQEHNVGIGNASKAIKLARRPMSVFITE